MKKPRIHIGADIWCALFLCDMSVIYFPFASFSCCKCQNYFKDGWNIFDCVTVLGSITDILVTELGVSKRTQKRQVQTHKRDILATAEGTLARVCGRVHLCHCLRDRLKARQ